jgi:diadenosine tetraphosphate (Ap4A) HIT family hydrolase
MSIPEELMAIRKRLDALTTEELHKLPPEELQAFMVTLRAVLERAEEVRAAPAMSEYLERLQT